MSNIVIRDVKKLTARIVSARKAMAKLREDCRVIGISCLFHMGEHQNPTKLNEFYGMLNLPLQAGFKRMVSAVGMDFLKAEGKFLEPTIADLPFKMVKDAFEVKKGSVERLKAFAEFIDLSATDEDKTFGDFFDRKVEGTRDPFDVLAIDKALKSLLARAQKKDNGIPINVQTALAEALGLFEHKVKSELDLAEGKREVKAPEVPAPVLLRTNTSGELVAVH